MARYHVEALDGTKKRVTLYARSRSEISAKLAAAIAERDGKGPVDFEAERMTVAEYLMTWLAGKENELSTMTYRKYREAVVKRLIPAFGRLRVGGLRPAHIEAYKARLVAEGLAPSTIKYQLAILSGALNRAVSWELAAKNPASGVKRPKETKKMRALSEEEAARLIGAVRGTRREALYSVACKLGPRQGELRGLRWQDLNLDGATPTMTIAWSCSTHHGVRWGPPKNGESRVVRLPKKAVEVLRRHRSMQLEERVSSRGWQDPELVFPNTIGAVNSHSIMHRNLKGDLRKAGLPVEVRFHDLRHTAATLALRANTPVPVVAKMLGHADPALTLRRYSHVLPDMDQRAADAIDDYLF
jgi:integrase